MRRVLCSAALVAVTLIACGNELPAESPPGDDGGVDAAPASDASASDVQDSGSCWPYRPANYDPCTASFDQDHPSSSAKIVTGNETIDTNTANDTLANGSVTYALYRFASLAVAAGGKLTIQGSRPVLIIVDGDVDLQGPIVVMPNTAAAPMECGARPDVGSPITNYTNGGGGGGFGGGGGAGGGGGPAGGAANGNQKIAPLRFGCPGGMSGTPKPQSNNSNAAASPAPGGAGGGAIEISARGAITVANTASVVANGEGGGGGDAHKAGEGPCQTADVKDCDSGGGGGGSGGSVVLEGANVTVMGLVCAVGGGGGAGGADDGIDGVRGATSTSCAVAAGGATPIAGGNGGTDGAATVGTAGGGGYTSSGGGGGGAGRIRIRASGSLKMTGTVFPPAYTL